MADRRYALASSDELLGYAVALDTRLDEVDPSGSGSLRAGLDRFTTALRSQRDGIEARMAMLAESHEAALLALDEAAVCEGVDQRDPSKDADEVAASPPGGAPLLPATSGEERARRDRVRTRNREQLASEACRGQVRLWRAVGGVELSSRLDLRGVSSHVRELSVDEGTAPIRDRLVTALEAHADNLRELDRLLDSSEDDPLPIAREAVTVAFALGEELEGATRSCLATLEPAERARGRRVEPRVATVVVRPEVSEPLSETGSFGSGFVVQWETRDGRALTRVVTNAHVMQGASSAELRPSREPIEDASSRPEDRPDPIVARLVRSLPYDDIAVLEIEDSERTRELFGEGLRLRRGAVSEQEPITAAGFPGVGGTPSYQVSQGVVSNSRFGSAQGDASGVTGYIQHTAPIDPGNSGGPLLDSRGRVVGMNTLKVVGRENVGLAIPVPRIQFAMLRADEPLRFEAEHARATCNLVVGALGADRPELGALERLGLSLHDALGESLGRTEATWNRGRVLGEPRSEADAVRVRIYGALRSMVEQERGIVSYGTCGEIEVVDGAEGRRFVASFRTRAREHQLLIGEEDGRLRVIEVRTPTRSSSGASRSARREP